jgi:trimethylamine:corrinoid methyltransferase-like protein
VVDDDTLALDVIAGIMEGSRNFLDLKHTARHLRGGALLFTHLAERRAWEEWSRSGRETMAMRAQAEAERLLASHQVQSLTEDQDRELDEIMKEAESELALA